MTVPKPIVRGRAMIMEQAVGMTDSDKNTT